MHGELRVLPDSDNPDRFSLGSVVYARPERGKVGAGRRDRLQLTVSGVRGDATFPIVAFEEVVGREGAEALRGLVLEVPGSELPPLEEDEFYPFELIGLEVRDDEGVVRARVEDVLDNPAHSLLVLVPVPLGGSRSVGTVDIPETAGTVEVEQGPREMFVPFVEEAVPLIDVEGGYLVVAARFLEQS